MGMIRSTLEEVEQLKNDAIREIQTELKKIREAHSNMVKTYEGKLSEFGIPVEELGFDPLVPANIWAYQIEAWVRWSVKYRKTNLHFT